MLKCHFLYISSIHTTTTKNRNDSISLQKSKQSNAHRAYTEDPYNYHQQKKTKNKSNVHSIQQRKKTFITVPNMHVLNTCNLQNSAFILVLNLHGIVYSIHSPNSLMPKNRYKFWMRNRSVYVFFYFLEAKWLLVILFWRRWASSMSHSSYMCISYIPRANTWIWYQHNGIYMKLWVGSQLAARATDARAEKSVCDNRNQKTLNKCRRWIKSTPSVRDLYIYSIFYFL